MKLGEIKQPQVMLMAKKSLFIKIRNSIMKIAGRNGGSAHINYWWGISQTVSFDFLHNLLFFLFNTINRLLAMYFTMIFLLLISRTAQILVQRFILIKSQLQQDQNCTDSRSIHFDVVWIKHCKPYPAGLVLLWQ